jgi:catechol 2,3-dioxygenase-like lactoylglutathione lyase family enzyme
VINGAHIVIYSRDADADRAFFRDVLGFDHVDAGGSWLIFTLPPSEVAVHPTHGREQHELFLMCDDLTATVAELTTAGASVAHPFAQERWGIRTTVQLPGGGEVGLYQPRHPRPPAPGLSGPGAATR